jgi:hypothetical protein
VGEVFFFHQLMYLAWHCQNALIWMIGEEFEQQQDHGQKLWVKCSFSIS